MYRVALLTASLALLALAELAIGSSRLADRLVGHQVSQALPLLGLLLAGAAGLLGRASRPRCRWIPPR